MPCLVGWKAYHAALLPLSAGPQQDLRGSGFLAIHAISAAAEVRVHGLLDESSGWSTTDELLGCGVLQELYGP